jgi:GDP-L-fucose synthase
MTIAPTFNTLLGTGTPKREFLYSEDMADACVYLMNLPDAQFTPLVNIGVGHDITIRELAETVAATVGYQGKLEFDATKPDGTPRKLMNVDRLNAMGWKAKTEMREGLVVAYQEFLTREPQ